MLSILVLALCCVTMAVAQKSSPLPPEQLAEISARGKMLAEYDQAAGYASDAVMATHPQQKSGSRFVCRKTDAVWTCIFGRLASDKLLIDYEAAQGATLHDFQVKHHDPPAEDTGFYFAAVKAMMVAGKDFQMTAEKRPYNPSVLPAPSGQFYVYIVPAQTTKGVFPLGGDARYVVTEDGNTVVEKRQLHKTILETTAHVPEGGKLAAGFHSHVLSDVPEDTDVLYVLSRKPLVPEMIATGKKQMYKVETDGTVKPFK
jgi:hypothetical protein